MTRADGDLGDGRPTRRAILAGAAAAMLLAACGKKDDGAAGTGKKAGSPPAGKTGPGGRPLKTTKRAHRKAQASASRSKDPLPADVAAYLERKHAQGALVASSGTKVLHHPVLCAKHLPTSKRAAHPKSKPAPASPVVHQRYADGIVYALLRDEQDRLTTAGLALSAALAWPVSTRLSDLAIARLRGPDRTKIDADGVSAALAAAAGGAVPRSRVDAGLRLLRARLDGRVAIGKAKAARAGMDGGR